MSKWVEVPVTITKVFMVKVEEGETVEEAVEWAVNDCMGDGEVSAGKPHIVTDELTVKSLLACADKVIQ